MCFKLFVHNIYSLYEFELLAFIILYFLTTNVVEECDQNTLVAFIGILYLSRIFSVNIPSNYFAKRIIPLLLLSIYFLDAFRREWNTGKSLLIKNAFEEMCNWRIKRNG